jgi:hypothetical protein
LLVRPSSFASSWTRIFPATCAVNLSSVAYRVAARRPVSLPRRVQPLRMLPAGSRRRRGPVVA